MDTATIQALIEAKLNACSASITGDGHHFRARVITPAFEGLSLLQRQRLVYAALGDAFASGALHALSIEALTPSEANHA